MGQAKIGNWGESGCATGDGAVTERDPHIIQHSEVNSPAQFDTITMKVMDVLSCTSFIGRGQKF